MQTPDPKSMARTLRAALAERSVTVSHSTALDLVARQLGHADWNVLAARIGQAEPGPQPPAPAAAFADGALPEGWNASGRSDLFRHDLQQDGGPGGTPALLIESRGGEANPQPGDFLTIMQRISATPSLGRTVSFRASLRCDDASGIGRIWIHARGSGREKLAFDNLGLERGPDGPISGSTGWTRRCVTIAVPDNALYVGFGVLFGSGAGRFQAADLCFGLAEAGERPRPLPEVPRNLELARAVD